MAAKSLDPLQQNLAAVRSVLQNSVTGGELPGAVCLVHQGGRLLENTAAGFRDLENRFPMTPDTIFNIASMTKPVTVAAALTLVEEGRLTLEAPISRWAPEFASMRVLRTPDSALDDTVPAPREITIQDLMTHHSGLAYGFTAPGPLGQALRSRFGMGISSELQPDEWMKALAELPLACAPGERFCYGHSTDVLGFIVGRAAGSLRDVLRERIFEPLGMRDTDFWVPPQKRARAATTYISSAPGEFAPTPLPSFMGQSPPSYTSGGQGLVSTALDYLAFARMLLGQGEADHVRVLKPQTVARMLTDVITPAEKRIPLMFPDWKTQGFGLGVSILTDARGYAASGRGAGSNGSFGWPGGFGGWWQADPVQNLVLIWLQQTVPPPPAPGGAPRIPGLTATLDFQAAAYAGLMP